MIKDNNRIKLHVCGIDYNLTQEEFNKYITNFKGIIESNLIGNDNKNRKTYRNRRMQRINDQPYKNKGYGFCVAENDQAAYELMVLSKQNKLKLSGRTINVSPYIPKRVMSNPDFLILTNVDLNYDINKLKEKLQKHLLTTICDIFVNDYYNSKNL